MVEPVDVRFHANTNVRHQIYEQSIRHSDKLLVGSTTNLRQKAFIIWHDRPEEGTDEVYNYHNSISMS